MTQIIPLDIPSEYHELFVHLAHQANQQALKGKFSTTFITPYLLKPILPKYYSESAENILSEEEIAFILALYN